MSNARHREALARHSKQPDVLAEMVGMDDGKHDAAIAGNEHTPADVLASLALSDNISVGGNVAGNKMAALATFETLMQDDNNYAVKWQMAANPSTPLNILEALATDEDDNVRAAVMVNSASPEKLLMSMLADPANTNLDLEGLYCNKNLTLPCLVDVIGKHLERDGVLSVDFQAALFEHELFESIKDALPEGNAIALSKCNGHSLRNYSMEIPSLSVVDILRLVEDPELDDVSIFLKDIILYYKLPLISYLSSCRRTWWEATHISTTENNGGSVCIGSEHDRVE